MAKTDTSITTIDDAQKAVEPPAAVALHVADQGDKLSGKRIELTVHQGEGDMGKQPLFVGLNGTGFNIPRGIPVSVPVEVIEILDNAMMTVYESVAGLTRGREVKRYSYNTRELRAA